MPQSYDFIFISARDFCQKLLKKFGTHILLGKNLRHLRYLRDNEQVTLIHIKLGMTCKVRTGKQNIPFFFLVTDNCSHFSSDELIKPRQRYKKYSFYPSYWIKKCWFYSIRWIKWIKNDKGAICHDDKCKRIHHSFIVTIRYIDYNSCNYSVHPYCHELLR